MASPFGEGCCFTEARSPRPVPKPEFNVRARPRTRGLAVNGQRIARLDALRAVGERLATCVERSIPREASGRARGHHHASSSSARRCSASRRLKSSQNGT